MTVTDRLLKNYNLFLELSGDNCPVQLVDSETLRPATQEAVVAYLEDLKDHDDNPGVVGAFIAELVKAGMITKSGVIVGVLEGQGLRIQQFFIQEIAMLQVPPERVN